MKKDHEAIASGGRKWRKMTLIMKLKFILLLFMSVQLSAAVHSQTAQVTLKMSNVTLEQVLWEIQKQTDFVFMYGTSDIAGVTGLNVDMASKTVEEILDYCLKGTKLRYEISGTAVVIKMRDEEKKKQLEIKGVVKDSKNQPLPGVTVIEKGTSVGVATDVNGRFVFVTTQQDSVVLLFSFVGMKTREVIWRGQKELNVKLEENVQDVEEVVVTGYANINKKSFTGTSVQVTGEELMKASPNNIIQSLSLFDPSFRMVANNAMGSDPNTLPEFYIRGRSGIGNTALDISSVSESELRNNPNLPTFILDGYEVDVQKVYDLDPSRVKSITILKDAASTAIYGSRAANGVVVIETIAPQEGELRVYYNFNGGLSTPDLSVYHLLNARDKLELERLAGLFDAKDTDLPSVALDKEKPYYARLSEINRGVDTYWLSQPVRTAFSHKHNATISGGSERLRYGLNLKYDQTSGVMKGSDRLRMSLGVDLSYRVKDVMFTNNLEWASTHAEDSPYGDFSTYASRNPYDAFKNEDGSYKKILSGWANVNENPLYDANLMSYSKEKTHDISNNFSIKWFVTDHLRAEGRIAIRSTFTANRDFVDPEDSSFDQTTLEQKGSLSVSNSNSSSWDANLFVAYNKAFNLHHLSVTLGANFTESESESSSYKMTGFASGSTDDQNFAANSTKPSGGSSKNRLVGVFTSINYTFNEIYLFDFSGRYDGASQFGSNNRFAPFYSVGFGINIHNYAFMKNNVPWVNNLKVRVTYGILGNSSFNQNLSKKMYQYNFSNWYIDGVGATIQVLGNPDLKWERSRNLDLGLDFNLFGRVNATLGYYWKVTNDLIGDITLPSSTGFKSYKSNLGKVVNKGVELSLNMALIQKQDISLNVYGNLAHNKNVLEEISDALRDYNEQVTKYYEENPDYNAPLLRYYEGASLTSIYAMKSLGINPADGKEIFLKKDGTPTYEWDANEHVICGDTEPTVSGSFGVNLSWKGFFLFSGFMYECGGDMENTTLLSKVENANVKANVDERVFSDRWKKPGDVSKYKALEDWQSNTRTTSRFIQKNNFVSFNSVTLGYTFTSGWMRKLGLSMLKCQFSANDLGRISTIKVERGTSYPFARTYNFSVNVGF